MFLEKWKLFNKKNRNTKDKEKVKEIWLFLYIDIYQSYQRMPQGEKFGYWCLYVTAIKPDFHECFRADNGKNQNMPTKRMKTISRHSFFSFFFKSQGYSHVRQLLILPISFLVLMPLFNRAEIITWLFRNPFLTWGGEGVL